MRNDASETHGLALAVAEEPVDIDGYGTTSLRNATLEGVRWITYGRIAYEILAFASLAILAHLIAPAEYGHVAIALILQTLAISLTSEGFGNPLVQRKLVDRGHFESAALMSVAFGILLGGLVVLAAPFIITPVYGARTTHLFQLAALLFPIYGFITVPEAILQRRLDLRRITIVETSGSLVGAILSVGLAVAGMSGTAIVLGTIAGAVVTGVMLFAAVGMPRPRWHRGQAQEVTSYGVPASLAGLVYLGVRNVDNVIVGARLGALQLGIYYRAYALGVINQLKIGMILLRVSFPALSRSKDAEHMRILRDRMTRLNAVVIVPLLVLLAITAPKLVPFVLGSHWKLAVVPTQILAFAGIATTLTYCTTPFLLASGHPKAVLNLNIGTFFVYGAAILIAVPHGLRAVCVAVVATNVLTMLAAYVLMARLTQVPLRRIVDDSGPALVGTAALTGVALPLMDALSGNHVPAIAVLSIVGIVGAAVYLLTLHALFRPALKDVLLVARGVLARKSRPIQLDTEPKQAARRVPARRWAAVAFGLPVLSFGLAWVAGKATVNAPIRHAAPVAAAKATPVNLLAVAPIDTPPALQIQVPRPAPPHQPAPAATRVAPAVALPSVAPAVSAPAVTHAAAPASSSPAPVSSGSGSNPVVTPSQPVTPTPAPSGPVSPPPGGGSHSGGASKGVAAGTGTGTTSGGG